MREYDGISTTRDSMNEIYIQGAELTDNLGFPILEAVWCEPERTVDIHQAARVRDTRKCIVHCYVDDTRLEPVWKDAYRWVDNLRDFPYMVMPDLSINGNMPQAMKYWQRYRNMVLADFFTTAGIKVVPSLGCMGVNGDDEWLIEGMPHDSTLAVSSKGRIQDKRETAAFLAGLEYQLEMLQPHNLLFFGTVPAGFKEVCPTIYFAPEKRGE